MSNNYAQINFLVDFSINGTAGEFKIYNPDGSKAPDPFDVQQGDTHIIYTLRNAPDGTIFVPPRIQEHQGMHDITEATISTDQKTLTLVDTDANSETIHVWLQVQYNGHTYPSADPQVRNKVPPQ